MRGDVTVEGYTLRITFGALEQVCEIYKVDPAPVVIMGALQSNIYTVPELSSVLRAALMAGGEKITPAEFVDKVGIVAARDGVLQAMINFFDTPGKDEAAKEEAPAS